MCSLEKAMATHSSVLAWRIPGMGEPGGLPSMGSHRVGHNWSNLAAAAPWSLKTAEVQVHPHSAGGIRVLSAPSIQASWWLNPAKTQWLQMPRLAAEHPWALKRALFQWWFRRGKDTLQRALSSTPPPLPLKGHTTFEQTRFSWNV